MNNDGSSNYNGGYDGSRAPSYGVSNSRVDEYRAVFVDVVARPESFFDLLFNPAKLQEIVAARMPNAPQTDRTAAAKFLMTILGAARAGSPIPNAPASDKNASNANSNPIPAPANGFQNPNLNPPYQEQDARSSYSATPTQDFNRPYPSTYPNQIPGSSAYPYPPVQQPYYPPQGYPQPYPQSAPNAPSYQSYPANPYQPQASQGYPRNNYPQSYPTQYPYQNQNFQGYPANYPQGYPPQYPYPPQPQAYPYPQQGYPQGYPATYPPRNEQSGAYPYAPQTPTATPEQTAAFAPPQPPQTQSFTNPQAPPAQIPRTQFPSSPSATAAPGPTPAYPYAPPQPTAQVSAQPYSQGAVPSPSTVSAPKASDAKKSVSINDLANEKTSAKSGTKKARKEKKEAPKREKPTQRVKEEEVNPGAIAALAATAAPETSADLTTLAAKKTESADLKELSVAPGEDATSPDAYLENLGRAASARGEFERTDVDYLRGESTLEKAKEDAPMWLMSLALHIAVAFILALLVTNSTVKKAFEVVSEPGFSDEVVLDDVFDPDASLDFNEQVEFNVEANPEVESVTNDVPDVSAFSEETAAPISITETSVGLEAPLGEVDNLLGSLMGNDLSGRGESKAAALASSGGSEGSEKSVALALAWLAEHQLPDGSWNYDLRYCPTCKGSCSHTGSNKSSIAATSMGILPFLAAGHTPTQGKYRRVVANGLNYLLSQGKETEYGVSFRDDSGTMYAHGLATITLCETYAMLTERERSKYRKLQYIAQSAIHFIEYAQATDGGWRYTPKQPGDTSVFGWQMMALKSGQLAGFAIDDAVVFGARNFLKNVVSFDYERKYYYQAGSSESAATNSIGLLCRLYLDWTVENPTLLQGATNISGIGPRLNNPYYTYYAAQLMHNVGGAMWNKWNDETRDKLVAAQCLDGHERGSWFPDDPDGHCSLGGRLYATSFNCMVLEVYYRHMPLYQKMEAKNRFPLDSPIELPAKKTSEEKNPESEESGEKQESTEESANEEV